VVKRAVIPDAKQPRGIPFFLKTQACKHETVWAQPVYILSLKTTFTPDKKVGGDKSEPEISSRTVVLTLEEYRSEAVLDLYKSLTASKLSSDKQENEIKNIEEKWAAVVAKAPIDPYSIDEDKLGPTPTGQKTTSDSKRVMLLTNDVIPETYVDYSSIYYYNSSKPWLGSSQASVKLAADGTMTEGAAQQESKTLQAFLDLLPIKEVLSAAAKGAVPLAAIEGRDIPGVAKYELTTEVKTFKHTHYIIKRDELPPCAAPKDEVITPAYNLVLEEISESKKTAPKDGEIAISGSIVLPKTAQPDSKPVAPPQK
jgi:hypothetical protein